MDYLANYNLQKEKENELSNLYYEKGRELSKKYISRLKTILSKHTYADCKLIFSSGNTTVHYSDNNSVSFRCDIGFQKSDNSDAMEFGSSFSFYYEEGKIAVNCGTIGQYNLEDKFQLARNSIIYHLTCVHGKQIQDMFNSVPAYDFIDSWKQYCIQSGEVRKAKTALDEWEYAQAKAKIKLGVRFYYDEHKATPLPISSYYKWYKDYFKVTKVTDKYVYIDVSTFDDPNQFWFTDKKVKISQLVYYIQREWIIFDEDTVDENIDR